MPFFQAAASKAVADDKKHSKGQAPPKVSLAGRHICNGNIRFDAFLGKGGFGQVYRGVMKRSFLASPSSSGSIPVAIKAIALPELERTRIRLKAHIDEEVRFLKRLVHEPAVPTLYHVDEDEEFVYLIMEWCDSITLNHFVCAISDQARTTRGFETKKAALIELVDVLIRCHSLSIFHRDLKPENVLVGVDGKNLRLIDFGLAVNAPTSVNCRSGTKEYMSPECYSEYNHKDIKNTPFANAPSDVWSLGVLLYFVMVGQKLWPRPSFSEPSFVSYVVNRDSYFATTCGASVKAQKLLQRALELDPEKRLTLPAFREELSQLRSFYASASERTAQKALARRPGGATTPDVVETHRIYRDFWVNRSKAIFHANNPSPSTDNAISFCPPSLPPPGAPRLPPSPPRNRPVALKEVYLYADSLRERRPSAGFMSYTSVPASELLPPPALGAYRSFDTSVLLTPTTNASLAPPDVLAASAVVSGLFDYSTGREGNDAELDRARVTKAATRAKDKKTIFSGVGGKLKSFMVARS